MIIARIIATNIAIVMAMLVLVIIVNINNNSNSLASQGLFGARVLVRLGSAWLAAVWPRMACSRHGLYTHMNV